MQQSRRPWIGYQLYIAVLQLLLYLASFFNAKAKKAFIGRQKQRRSQYLAEMPKNAIWIHCASLGEFEQGRSLLDFIKDNYPKIPIILSFFSPSGYEVRHNYPNADSVVYLPLDTRKNAQTWMTTLEPRAVIFVKYEFWFHYLQEIILHTIPLYFIAVSLTANHWFYAFYSARLRNLLIRNAVFMSQDDSTFKSLHSLGANVSKVGDPRIDRVVGITPLDDPQFTAYVGGQKVLILASIYKSDARIIIKALETIFDCGYAKVIIVPHETDKSNIQQMVEIFGGVKKTIRYSDLSNKRSADFLIVDRVGILSKLYPFAHLAYVGGGFGKGIHNILEPMAAQIPMIIGPKYARFPEAVEMVNSSGAKSIKTTSDFVEAIQYFQNNKHYRHAADVIYRYLKQHAGATRLISNRLKQDGIFQLEKMTNQ